MTEPIRLSDLPLPIVARGKAGLWFRLSGNWDRPGFLETGTNAFGAFKPSGVKFRLTPKEAACVATLLLDLTAPFVPRGFLHHAIQDKELKVYTGETMKRYPIDQASIHPRWEWIS